MRGKQKAENDISRPDPNFLWVQEKNMNIIWKEWQITPEAGSLGHGIHFHDKKRNRESDLIAFVDGFHWLHELSCDVVIYCIKPDATTDTQTLGAMKNEIEQYVCSKNISPRMITRRIESIVNG